MKLLKLLPLLGLLWITSASPFAAFSPDSISSPYRFSLFSWEIRSLANITFNRLLALLNPPTNDITAVKSFFNGDKSVPRSKVEIILARQIEEILYQEGLAFPPVIFRLDDPPHLLIISPKERIELKQTILLRQRMPLPLIETLEGEVEEKLRVSALVESLGGVSTYPSFVLSQGLEGALDTIAHEWLHHYLFFYPLGRAYRKSPEMTTLNESIADLAGKEIARQVLKSFYGIERKEEAPKGEDYFTRRMRYIRLKTEELLSQGKVKEAESFMEEEKKELVKRGYHIRRLNQAYFAFHGSYASSPASISPIEEELKKLRYYSPSLGEFIRSLAFVGSYEEFQQLLRNRVPE